MDGVIYCNGCGMLHDPDDGGCIVCELQSKLKSARKVIDYYAKYNWHEDTDQDERARQWLKENKEN